MHIFVNDDQVKEDDGMQRKNEIFRESRERHPSRHFDASSREDAASLLSKQKQNYQKCDKRREGVRETHTF